MARDVPRRPPSRRGQERPLRLVAISLAAGSPPFSRPNLLPFSSLASPPLRCLPPRAHHPPSCETRRRRERDNREQGEGETSSAAAAAPPPGATYLVGVGKADITGPVVEVGFAGYANREQVGTGLRQRLFSRAFIVADARRPRDRFVYLVLDTQSGDTAVRYGVLDGLRALGRNYSVYGHANVALTGTHSHAGPAGWFNYLLPQFTTFGFDHQSHRAIVDGTVLSIRRAHESLQEGFLDVGTTRIRDGAINRSLFAYLANPEVERKQYTDATDSTMTLMRFRRASDRKSIGVLSWFPVHGTSLLGNHTHAAAENKGVAAWLLEDALRNHSSAADGFVAGFSQANVGDTTPNVLGSWCDNGSGKPCNFEKSVCANGRSQACHGRGPAWQALDRGVRSCHEIGRRQYAGARNIYDSLDLVGTPVVGPSVKAFHFFHDMRFWEFTLPNGSVAMTCPAALGYAFAAGTSDWPGVLDFTQGDKGNPNASPAWKYISNILKKPSDRQVKCQGIKPILLDVGEIEKPYAWAPNIVDIQVLRVGQLVIIVSPTEATTMSGRRWKAAVAGKASRFLRERPIVVLGGPANTYAHYCATPEEYAIQRYEGASTLFGPHQLAALINLTVGSLHYLHPDATAAPARGPLPPDNRNVSFARRPGVVFDMHPLGRAFGSVLRQPERRYRLGAVVKATFQGANPRNNLRLERTFAAVERQGPDGAWTRVRDDSDWFLIYAWHRTNWLLALSEVDLFWETAGNAEPGTYRFRYYGDAKSLLGRVKPFEGTSSSFQLEEPPR